MSLLKIAKLNKSFGGLKAINDVDMAVHAGEILALIGPNGAGKSTLLNLITNYIRPDSGEVVFEGKSIVGMARHKIVKLGIARTFQALTIFENLTVEENISIGQSSLIGFRLLDLMRVTRNNDHVKNSLSQRILKIIDFVGIGESSLKSKVETLPLIDRKRVAIATALASEPKLLLLDEPLAGLNQIEAYELLDLVKKARRAGITILLIDHNLEAVMGIAERVICLNFGTLIMDGTPEKIVCSKEIAECYLGSGYAEGQ